MPTIKEHNVETGEVIEREMTAEEIASLPKVDEAKTK
jgi:hypothetical protein